MPPRGSGLARKSRGNRTSQPTPLASEVARRFARAAAGLDAFLPDVGAALARHGYVQLDPINVCGRMHDLMLRNRVAGYREHELLRHLYGSDGGGAPPAPAGRRAFEHYLPGANTLAAFPPQAFPYLAPFMEERRGHRGGYRGRLSAAEERLARRVLAEIADRGALAAGDIAHEGRALTAWGTRARLVKTVLEKLFFHGRVLLATRRSFRRVYDLPERVLPASVLEAPRPAAQERARWLALLRLRQRRLVMLRRGELPLVEDLVHGVRIEGCPPCAVLREDAPLLAAEPDAHPPLRLLAPLDPLVYDRRLTRALWGFDYTWEVYTPPGRRVRGYYALPVLAGTRLAGHVDLMADRARGRLEVVSRRVERGVAVQPAVRALAAFLGLEVR